MNRNTVLIGTCIVGVLIGLGFLGKYLHTKETKREKAKKKEEENNLETQTPENSEKSAPQKQETSKKPTPVIPLQRKKEEKKQVASSPQGENPNPKSAPLPVANMFPLQLGSKGKQVERLQVWLMRNYGGVGIISKEFDQKTLEMVRKYLKTDTVDETTYQKMKMDKPVHEQTRKY